ncbi:MAG: DUF1566 domain-containing protein [Desulfoarculaceae bacterium]|nr:DUF1566 domain-containing protein [Desulfoarculaceae bacterium]
MKQFHSETGCAGGGASFTQNLRVDRSRKREEKMAKGVGKRRVAGIIQGGLIWLALLLVCALSLAACKGGKSSSVEGKLVDWNNKPVAGVKITAYQVQPIKGYEQFEAVTGADGSFALKGLFPSSAYVLKPWSDKWTTTAKAKVDSAPQGETAVLPQPMKIERAFAQKGGGEVGDLVTGAARFQVSADGMITDGQTKLEWVVGPDQDTNYAQAEQWVAACQVAGGGWRMPTGAELNELYRKGVGERNMVPPFKTTGWWVWAEPRDSSSAWLFDFYGGNENWRLRDNSNLDRVFGVRSLPR